MLFTAARTKSAKSVWFILLFIKKKIDKKATIVFAEIDIETLAGIENAGIAYEEVSKYPEIDVDLSFVSRQI